MLTDSGCLGALTLSTKPWETWPPASSPLISPLFSAHSALPRLLPGAPSLFPSSELRALCSPGLALPFQGAPRLGSPLAALLLPSGSLLALPARLPALPPPPIPQGFALLLPSRRGTGQLAVSWCWLSAYGRLGAGAWSRPLRPRGLDQGLGRGGGGGAQLRITYGQFPLRCQLCHFFRESLVGRVVGTQAGRGNDQAVMVGLCLQGWRPCLGSLRVSAMRTQLSHPTKCRSLPPSCPRCCSVPGWALSPGHPTAWRACPPSAIHAAGACHLRP